MAEEVEQVLVVPAEWVNALCSQGFSTDVPDNFVRELANKAFFMLRPEAEINPSFRQVIPYVLVCYQGKYLTVARQETQTEKRLHNKVSFGIGGHINPVDEESGNVLDAGLQRELSEELAINNPPHLDDLKLVGTLRDDVNEVGLVHFGLVLRWDVTAPVSIRETDKMIGEYLTLDEIGRQKERLENWSQLVYEKLASPVATANN
ncbi:MAG: hypothetical protein V1807_01615 [Patescibacteria group bacterium]